MASATVAECSRCGGRWPVFAESVEPQRGSARFHEQERYWETGATQTRTIDNSRRDSELEQIERFAHEWRAAVTIDKDVSTSAEFSALGTSAERAVKVHYDLSHETVRTDTTELQVTVQPRTISKITLRPEYEWRRGVVHMQDGRRWVDLPYHARVGVNLRVDVDEAGA